MKTFNHFVVKLLLLDERFFLLELIIMNKDSCIDGLTCVQFLKNDKFYFIKFFGVNGYEHFYNDL